MPAFYKIIFCQVRGLLKQYHLAENRLKAEFFKKRVVACFILVSLDFFFFLVHAPLPGGEEGPHTLQFKKKKQKKSAHVICAQTKSTHCSKIKQKYNGTLTIKTKVFQV